MMSYLMNSWRTEEIFNIIVMKLLTFLAIAQQQTLGRYVCNCYYYDRAVHVSVAVDMRTLLDRNNFSSSSNGQVSARRVTGLIIKRLWYEDGNK